MPPKITAARATPTTGRFQPPEVVDLCEDLEADCFFDDFFFEVVRVEVVLVDVMRVDVDVAEAPLDPFDGEDVDVVEAVEAVDGVLSGGPPWPGHWMLSGFTSYGVGAFVVDPDVALLVPDVELAVVSVPLAPGRR